MSEHPTEEPLVAKRPFFPRMVRVLAIPIILFWGLLAISTNTFMPKLEDVAEELAGPQVPHYAPSQRALLHIGEKFQESNSTSLAMVVLEANQPLGDVDHRYYDELMRRLLRDTKHVQSSIDLWGKPITAAGAQSLDGKATYVLLRLGGDIGQMQANESVDAVRNIVAKDPPPPGLKVYVSGAAPLASDTLAIANSSLNNITIVTIILIFVMLLLVYRSVITLLVPLLGVLFELLVARGVIATLGHYGFIELSSFAVNILVSLTLGAGRVVGVFLGGRYPGGRESRRGQGGGVLHRVSGGRTDHHRLGAHDRRGVLLLDVRATELLPHHGARRCHQHAVYHRRRADTGPGPVDVGQPVRALRSQRHGEGDALSAGPGG